MIDKIRLHLGGELPDDYRENFGSNAALDGVLARFLNLEHSEIVERTAEGGFDEEILEWCYQNGRRLNEGDLLVWNNFSSKFGWNDFATPTLERRKKALGISDRADIQTMSDLFDYEEGRRK